MSSHTITFHDIQATSRILKKTRWFLSNFAAVKSVLDRAEGPILGLEIKVVGPGIVAAVLKAIPCSDARLLPRR